MSKKYILLITFICSFVLYQVGYAQTYNFINYNVGEGIEQSDILCLSQASNGYLLYGSNGGGLGYYDGYGFSAIKEKNGLANNVVFSISLDDKNNVWCTTNGGVNKLSPNLKKVLATYSEGLAFYCSHYSQSKKKMFFGSAQGVYYITSDIDSIQKMQTSSSQLNNAFINAIYTDSKGNLWVSTRQSGLFKVTGKNVIQITENDGLNSNYIKVAIEHNNKIWVGSLNGLNLIENDTVSNFDLPNDAGGSLTITSATKYKNELVFGSLTNHLYFVNPEENSFRFINEKNGFNFKKVWSIFTDVEENLWFGTLGQGIARFNATFTYFNKSNGLSSNNINTILCNDDRVWVGYKGGAGISIIENNKIVRSLTPQEIGSTIINRIVKIDDDIYIGRNEGLSIYKNDEINNVPFANNAAVDVYSIYQHQKVLYVGTKYGLYHLKDDSLHFVQGSPKDFIFDVISYNDKLYLASNNGYYIYSGNKFEFVSEQEDFNVGRVRSFSIDKKNSLWLATDAGLYVKIMDKHQKIDEAKGLASDNIYFLQIDQNDNIWVGTNKGVDRVNVLSVYDNFDEIEIRNYGKSEGFVGVECNLNAVSISNKKQLWFGTIDGAYLYNEQADELNQIPPKITLKNIKLNFKDVDWSNYTNHVDELSGLPNLLELNHQDNNFIFEFVGVSLKNPEKVYYQYQLEGLDEEWLPLTTDRKAVYSSLSPGDYVFKLRAKNKDDVWVENPTTFSFAIFPPWYQTKVFYVLVVILLIIIIYSIMYFRTRNLKKTQQLLTIQVDERTKELREEKDKVEEQKKVIEVANKNITDSINYAKRIQEAILPKTDKLAEYSSNFSVLYLPKDVVSGDFYWYDKIDSKIVLAAADCTGHGVPGAFMSMIGVNNLNQIILENRQTNPSNILIQLNKAIKKVLRQEDVGSESRDGMDISICCFDIDTNKIQYSGAFRPLLYIRNNELIEIKGSRNPIGGNAPNDFVYDLNEFDFKSGDVFYMFSDGYPDQFGGEKGKKFMNKRLKQIFIDHHQKSPDKQTEILREEFYKWMGDEEQVDDILVMCIKF